MDRGRGGPPATVDRTSGYAPRDEQIRSTQKVGEFAGDSQRWLREGKGEQKRWNQTQTGMINEFHRTVSPDKDQAHTSRRMAMFTPTPPPWQVGHILVTSPQRRSPRRSSPQRRTRSPERQRREDIRGYENPYRSYVGGGGSGAFTTGSLKTTGDILPPTVEWTPAADDLLRKAVVIFGDGAMNPRAMKMCWGQIAGQSWLTAAIPMDNPYCSCKLTCVRSRLAQQAVGRWRPVRSRVQAAVVQLELSVLRRSLRI